MSTFANRLQDSINMRGVTQSWLAEKANTTEATISRYANARRELSSFDTIAAIAKSLNVSSDYLLGLSNVPDAQVSLPPEQVILLKCFAKISDADSAVLWALLDKYMSPGDRAKLDDLHKKETADVG